MRARLPQLAVRPVLGFVADRTIRPVRLAPQRALPVARLPQQVIPFDLLVVLRLEQIDVRRHVVARVIVHVANQPALPRQPDHRRQERLRDAVGDVRALRVAPLGDDVAVARDDAARGTAILDRTDEAAERLLAEAVVQEQRHVVRARRVRGDRQLHRLVDERRVHPDVFRLLVLPVEPLREVDAGAATRCAVAAGCGRPLSDAILRERGDDDDGDEDDGKRASQHEYLLAKAAV